MKLKTKTDKFGVTTITCKGKAKETFDSFAASSYSLGNEWFLPFRYELKKKTTTLKFSANNMQQLDEFLCYALLREQFAELLMGISNFLTYSREHSVQSDYVLFDAKFVLVSRENNQLKFVYLPFKTPEEPLKPLYDFLVDIGRKLKLANASQDAHLLQRYRDFFVLRELFSITAFKDMVDSIYNETFNTEHVAELQPPKTADLNMDCYEVLSGKENTFAQCAVVPEAGVREGCATEVDVPKTNVVESGDLGAGEPEKGMLEAGGAGAVTVILTRKSNGQQFVCDHFPCVIGSSAKADIVIKGDTAISRMHAQIDSCSGGQTDGLTRRQANMRTDGCANKRSGGPLGNQAKRYAGKSASMDVFTITDLGSTNGTYLKNKKIAPHEAFDLAGGDTIRLANEFFIFELRE